MKFGITSWIYNNLGEELIQLPQSTSDYIPDISIEIKKLVMQRKITPKIVYFYIPPNNWKESMMEERFRISHEILENQYKLPLESAEDLMNFIKYLMIPFLQYGKSWKPEEYYTINPDNYPDLNPKQLFDAVNPIYSINEVTELSPWEGLDDKILAIPYTDKLLPFITETNEQ